MSPLQSLIYTLKLYTLAEPFYGGVGHIITLHRVVEKLDDNRILWSRNLDVTTTYLEETITYFISRNYDIISLDEMYRRFTQNEFHKKFVVFTFDDGYEDNFTLAYPLFKKYNLPFAVYITKALIEKNLKCWCYDIEDVLLCYNKITVGDIDLDTSTKEKKERAFLKIRSRIIHTTFESGYGFYRMLMARYPPCMTHAHWETMSKEQLMVLNADPLVTLGAHTVNHYPLNKLNLAEATLEVVEGKNYLEDLLQKPVEHFSYPYGSTDEIGAREIEIVKSAGFITGTTARSSNVFLNHRYSLCSLPGIPLIETQEEKKIFKMSLSGFLPAYSRKGKKAVAV